VGWETVRADGEIVYVDAEKDKELAVAMRGSGSQFGTHHPRRILPRHINSPEAHSPQASSTDSPSRRTPSAKSGVEHDSTPRRRATSSTRPCTNSSPPTPTT